jgi:hypothetical protein
MVNVPLLNPNATKREYFWLWTLTLIENLVALSIEVQATYSIGSSHLPYIVRTRDRRPSTAACPACWATGTKKLK